MGLNFPNPVRRFDPGRSCVSFWGSDASLEVTFQIDFDALRKLSPDSGEVEAEMLRIFDSNREKIQDAARTIDAAWPDTPATNVEVTTHWPPFALPEQDRLRAALLSAVNAAGLNATAKIAGHERGSSHRGSGFGYATRSTGGAVSASSN